MKILNLGCGSRASLHPDVVNIDWSIMLRIRTNNLLKAIAPLLLNGDRMQQFISLPDNVMAHDLRCGIPFPDASVDVVYHSHVLEHMDREDASSFLRDCARVLRPGGIIRIVVPDFECYCRNYIRHVEICMRDGEREIARHDKYFEPMLLQSVRREAFGSSQQKPLRRTIENLLLGDARKRGETHQWMYDRFNLTSALQSSGFSLPELCAYNMSRIQNWEQIGLDYDKDGMEYKPESLYMEAIRPEAAF